MPFQKHCTSICQILVHDVKCKINIHKCTVSLKLFKSCFHVGSGSGSGSLPQLLDLEDLQDLLPFPPLPLDSLRSLRVTVTVRSLSAFTGDVEMASRAMQTPIQSVILLLKTIIVVAVVVVVAFWAWCSLMMNELKVHFMPFLFVC